MVEPIPQTEATEEQDEEPGPDPDCELCEGSGEVWDQGDRSGGIAPGWERCGCF